MTRKLFVLMTAVALLGAFTTFPATSAAAAETGVVRIVYDAIPHHGHNFTFVGDLGKFRLDDDHDANLPRLKVMTVSVPDSPFVVKQVPDETWPLVSLSCSDHESSVNVARHTATIHVKAGENVTCTWVNHNA